MFVESKFKFLTHAKHSYNKTDKTIYKNLQHLKYICWNKNQQELYIILYYIILYYTILLYTHTTIFEDRLSSVRHAKQCSIGKG